MSQGPGLPPDSGNDVYLSKTLRHAPTDLLLDDAVASGLVRSVLGRSVRVAVGTFLLFVLLWVVNGGVFSRGDDAETWLIVGAPVAFGAFVAYWLAFLTGEKQEAISEWCTLLAGKAGAADSVYSHIAGGLRDRQLPIHNYQVRRTATAFGATGNRLVLVDGHHYVFVSVFAYGTSLYLGWTMWRIRRGRVLLQQSVGRHSADRFDAVGRILDLERLKAMREAVHATCREALDAAVRDEAVAETYGFPSGMPPVEGLPYGQAPSPNRP
ncbi:hypothetical protein V5P93_005147 [Actinokineospora auranticolor]|uniref:Uncharacterized protein n=1 Tax=Actinokineospora auranticolor TaxID=155976 RepID=A0A2S6GKE0_9PSEU|nr:hypothetical protein [Actinokineospora auranticolor]PPK65679.1 hypothetical protein CLV40_113163 [Actinokineospora auranticolor]